jgi:hypothetical protein
VSRFPLKFKANRKLHLLLSRLQLKAFRGQSKHSIAPSFRELYGCWLNIPSLPLIVRRCEAVFRGERQAVSGRAEQLGFVRKKETQH